MQAEYTLDRVLDKVEEYGGYGFFKFVRFEDNTYVFGHLDEQHNYFSRGDKVPVSAGFVRSRGDHFEVGVDGSITLNLYPATYDFETLPSMVQDSWDNRTKGDS